MTLSCGRSVAAAALIAATASAGSFAASAADIPPPAKALIVPAPQSAWTFSFSPYLWAAGIKGDVAVGPAVPPVNVDVGFDTILKHLHMTFMGVFEARYDKWGFIADISYLSERVSATGPLGFVNAKLEDKTFFGTFAAAYRAVEQQNYWIDVVAGGRAWWLSDKLDITAPGPIALSVNRDKSWFDPIIGARARYYASPQVYLEGYADVGGFGIGAKSDWQVAGLVGYDYSRAVTFFGGYRYLAVNYDRGGYVWDVALSGPLFGVTFKF